VVDRAKRVEYYVLDGKKVSQELTCETFFIYGIGVPDGSKRGPTGVSGGGIGVSVSGGGMGVSVSGGGTGVSVSVGGGTGVSVGVGMKVFVGGMVGGIGVFVGGTGVCVFVGIKVEVKVERTRLVKVGVTVTKRLGVDVSDGKARGESVLVGTRVGVGTNIVTACSVSAAAVSRLETARFTIFSGSIVIAIWLFKSLVAIVETLHSRLKPIAPAARTPKGPAYSLAFTLVALL
jgi:hypothetical protein